MQLCRSEINLSRAAFSNPFNWCNSAICALASFPFQRNNMIKIEIQFSVSNFFFSTNLLQCCGMWFWQESWQFKSAPIFLLTRPSRRQETWGCTIPQPMNYPHGFCLCLKFCSHMLTCHISWLNDSSQYLRPSQDHKTDYRHEVL